MQRLRKFLRRPPADRRLLMEALTWLVWARLLVWMPPFRWISPRLGRHMAETPEELDDAGHAAALKMSWAVESVAHHVPLGFVCLPQAMAAKWMLRRRHLSNTLYLGVRQDPQKPGRLQAHAWLRCGPRILTGGQGRQSYTVVATFGDLP